jgi:hypothetical protein
MEGHTRRNGCDGMPGGTGQDRHIGRGEWTSGGHFWAGVYRQMHETPVYYGEVVSKVLLIQVALVDVLALLGLSTQTS